MNQTVLLGDIANLKYGKMPKKDRVSNKGQYPIFTGYRIAGFYDEYNCDEKLIVVARGVGGTGDVKISPKKSYLTNISIMIDLDEEVASKKYLYYQLTAGLKYLDTGSAQSQITTSDLRRLKVSLPTIEEQNKIADILGTIDEKIELNRKMNETLEQMGQALFRHYFIDNPEAEKWEDGTVADLGKVITGKTPSKSKAEYYGGDVMFLKVPDMHGQSIIIKTEDMLSSLGADSQGNKYIPKWSTCVSCIATVGVVSLAGRQLQTNQQINSIVPKNRSYALFNYYLLKSKSETLKTMASGGSATPNLNKGHFERIKIKVPPIELLGRFQNESENLLHTVDENTHQIQTLTTLRDTLLPRLINGKIRL